MNSAIAGAVLASVAAGGLAYVFVYPLLSGEKRAEKRQKALVGSGPERRVDRIAAVNRRDQVAQSLKDLDARQKAQHKVTIELRIAQAGLAWTKKRFIIVSAGIGLFLALVLLVISGSPFVAAGGLFVGSHMHYMEIFNAIPYLFGQNVRPDLFFYPPIAVLIVDTMHTVASKID